MTVLAVVLTVLVLLMLLSIYMRTGSMSTTLKNYAETNVGASVINYVTLSSSSTKSITVAIPSNACVKSISYAFLAPATEVSFVVKAGSTEEGTDIGTVTKTTITDALASGASGFLGPTVPATTVGEVNAFCTLPNKSNTVYITITVSAGSPVTFMIETLFVSYGDFIDIS
jgi:hypothetical protein